MRPAITTLALAGLTTSGIAQNVGTVTVTTSATMVSVGEAFTIGVLLTDSIDGNSIFLFDIGIFGVGASFISDTPIGHPDAFGFSSYGASTPTGAVGAGGAPDILGPTLDISLDGLVVFTFQVHPTSPGEIEFHAMHGDLALQAAMFWAGHGGTVLSPNHYDELIFESVTVNVVPAPSPPIALMLAGLFAKRTRS